MVRFYVAAAAALTALVLGPRLAAAQAPATRPATTSAALKHLVVDVGRRQVRVECQALDVEAPLEFLCVVTGTNEHESLLRSPVRPADLHLALLMIGLESGKPVRYSETDKRWLAPEGPPVRITLEYESGGRTISAPAHSFLQNVDTLQAMPELTWVFVGSRVMPEGGYAADVTGYVVSVVNFDLTVIDIPQLASDANETLLWQRNPDRAPPKDTTLWMVIEPAESVIVPSTAPATQP